MECGLAIISEFVGENWNIFLSLFSLSGALTRSLDYCEFIGVGFGVT